MSTIKLGLFSEPSFMVSQISAAAAAKSLQSGPTLSDPMDCSLPGSSIHGIFQARLLEWGAIAFSDAYANKPFKASLQNSTSQR